MADFPIRGLIFVGLLRWCRCGGGLHTTVPGIVGQTAYESCCAHKAISNLLIVHFINSIPTGFRVRIVSVLSLSYEQIYSGHMK